MRALKVSDFSYSNTFQEYEKPLEKVQKPFTPKSTRKSNLENTPSQRDL